MARRTALLVAVALVGVIARMGFAQTTVALPDVSRTTLLTAFVSEQYQISLPRDISFRSARTASRAAAGAAAVSLTHIVLPTDTHRVSLSLLANAPSFMASAGGGATWTAADVTWNAANWDNATGSAGTLSSTAYTVVATADAGVTSMRTTGLTFTLAARPGIRCAPNQTLTVTCKIENIGL